jgi:opacity protein-like surface antigen
MMKKTIIAAVALLCLCGTAAAQRHIEFRWRGIYLTGDASYAMNLNRSVNSSGFSDTLGAIVPSLTGGFQFRKEAGVGLGVSYLADPTGAYTQLPIFAELRSHFMRSQITPYTVLQVGYSFPVGSSSKPPVIKIEEGGLYLGVEVGARYAFTRSVALGLHAGYKMFSSNKVKRNDSKNKPMLEEPVTLHCINFGLSFYFSNN